MEFEYICIIIVSMTFGHGICFLVAGLVKYDVLGKFLFVLLAVKYQV